MKIIKYRNPWYRINKEISYGPVEYKVESWHSVSEYKGYTLVSKTSQIDIVEQQEDEFMCISQVGSIRYAKAFIDACCVHGDYRDVK